jgi:translocator protein
MIVRTVIFLIINFVALGLGGLFTNKGVSSDWYTNLDKAPWTPPGWVFGAAWTLIMICFAIYMAYLWQEKQEKDMVIVLFVIQWILNIAWNPTFFYYQQVDLGLMVIGSLTLLVGYFLFSYWPELRFKSLLILPYFIWLLIATSLNAYILLKN